MSLKKHLSLIPILFFLVLFFQNCGVHKPQVEEMSSLSVGFSHTPTPSTCVNCHADTMPQVPIGSSNFSHSTIGSQDCFVCHNNAGKNWLTSQFTHTPAPTSCTSCHNTTRPASTQYFAKDPTAPNLNLYAHATQYNGGADCVSCHTSTPANIGVRWAGGSYNHLTNTGATVTTCKDCHTGSRPTTLVGASQFNHTLNGQGDCNQCHTNPGSNWATGAFSHTPTPTSCTSCHNSARPASTQYFAKDPAAPNLNLYAHATQYNGGADCVSCHTTTPANIGVRWAGGSYNHKTNTGATVTTCQDCHTGNRPTTLVGASQFNHTVNGQGDCIQCHTAVGVNWSANAVPATVSYPSPSTVSWAAITAPHPSTTSKTGISCTSCHTNYNSTLSIVGFDHDAIPTGTKCVSCHLSGQQVVKTTGLTGFQTKGSTHEGGVSYTKDCNSCHNKTQFSQFSFPTWNTTTMKFTGGKWK